MTKLLKKHCSTADFTIGSISMDINENIIDYFGGQEDLKNKILKFVGNPKDRIEEDKLRVLRGIRFICKYDLKPTIPTKQAIGSTDITDLPVERIRKEFLRIIEYKNGIDKLHEYTLLKQIIPELYHENNFKSGGGHHNETPFQHMLNSFKVAHGVTDDYRIKIASLLHDIGKATTRSVDEMGVAMSDPDIHFYQHETVGCDIARTILQRLKFSSSDTEFICFLIRKHMFGYKDKVKIKKKTYVKFFKKLEDNGVSIYDYLMLIYADHQGNEKKKRIKFGDFIKGNYLMQHYWECKYDNNTPFGVKDLAVSGKDVLKYIPAGPIVGIVLQHLFDDVMNGEIENNRPELLIRMQQRLSLR